MTKQSYSELLRDPRWQKMRLEIMHRDDFKCVNCGCSDKTLHVHHCFYKWGNNPWDYPKESLITLCCDCHEYESSELKNSQDFLINTLMSGGILSSHIDYFNERIITSKIPIKTLLSIFCMFIDDELERIKNG